MYRGCTSKPTPRSEMARLDSSVFKGFASEVFLRAWIAMMLNTIAVKDKKALRTQFATSNALNGPSPPVNVKKNFTITQHALFLFVVAAFLFNRIAPQRVDKLLTQWNKFDSVATENNAWSQEHDYLNPHLFFNQVMNSHALIYCLRCIRTN